MRWLRKAIFHNFWLKLLALAISFSLWALYTREPFAEVAYNVPIAYVNVPTGLAVSGDTLNTVHVLIRGRSGLLRRVVSSDLDISIDMTNTQLGDDDVRVRRRMVHVPYGTEVVEVTPTRLHVVLVTNSSPFPDAE
jgi:YbbR domain-containing protein